MDAKVWYKNVVSNTLENITHEVIYYNYMLQLMRNILPVK